MSNARNLANLLNSDTTITSADIADGTVATADIQDLAVSTGKIADGTVTHAKLHNTMDLSSKTVTLPALAGPVTVSNSSYPQLQLNSGVKNYHIFNDTGGNDFYIKNATDNINGFILTHEGYPLTGNRPAFFADEGQSTISSASVVKYTPAWNTGNHYSVSTGRFTAPVAGKYMFWCSIQAHGTTHQTYTSITARKNGTQYGPSEFVQTWAGGADHTSTTGSVLVDMAVNDYFDFHAQRGLRGIQGCMYGFLVG